MWIDGKHVAGEQMITCVGVTEAGHKKVLGFTQATTEHSGPIKELFRDLIERGLSFEEGLLCVVDGGKGLRKAIGDIFVCPGAALPVAQTGERREFLPKAPARVAKEVPARLPGADLRVGEGASYGTES